MSAKNTHVVMLHPTQTSARGEVVKVSAEDAERLVVNGHAREPRPGEVKAEAKKADNA